MDIADLKDLIDAAHGLSFGEDWNNGTAALAHRKKLLSAIARIKGDKASPQARKELHEDHAAGTISELQDQLSKIKERLDKIESTGCSNGAAPNPERNICMNCGKDLTNVLLFTACCSNPRPSSVYDTIQAFPVSVYHAIAALRYLANNDRPSGGEDTFNSVHLLQIAKELQTAFYGKTAQAFSEEEVNTWFA